MVRILDCLKAFGVILICFCVVFLETLFFSYHLDLKQLDSSLLTEAQLSFYEAQTSLCNMMHGISFGILGSFSLILLFFSIERYIEENRQNMGILKAMGYRRGEIAIHFVKYAIPTFIGCGLGYVVAFALGNLFYQAMNKDALIPEFDFQFHVFVFLGLLLIPTLLVGVFSILIAYIKLRHGPLEMMNGQRKKKEYKAGKEVDSYLKQLRRTILKNHKLLLIFEGFAVICFSSTIQMSFTLKKSVDTSLFLFLMMFGIGILLGVTILFLAFKFIYQFNFRYLSIMKAYGYQNQECRYAIYSGYHYVSMIAFVIGTFYQMGIMIVMFKVFSQTIEIQYRFDFLALLYALGIFLFVYILLFIFYYFKIKKIDLSSLNVNLD